MLKEKSYTWHYFHVRTLSHPHKAHRHTHQAQLLLPHAHKLLPRQKKELADGKKARTSVTPTTTLSLLHFSILDLLTSKRGAREINWLKVMPFGPRGPSSVRQNFPVWPDLPQS